MTLKEKAKLILATNISAKGTARVDAETLIETIEVNLAAARVNALQEIEAVVKERFDTNPNDSYYLHVEIQKIIKEMLNGN